MEHLVTFAGNLLDRAGNQRKNAAWLSARRDEPATSYLPLWGLRALMEPRQELRICWLPKSDIQVYRDRGETEVFLGLNETGVAHFAIDVSSAGRGRASAPFQDYGKWIDVRSAAASAPMADAAILAQSRSMIDWHDRHGFCAVCGHLSDLAEAGYMRKCSNEDCGASHFPRTDPVMICLVLDHQQNCMLGRQTIWPKGNWSALAGFMEPGENIEETVRREVMEEAGIKVGDVKYVCSQPWPFPSSLMMGCWAFAESTEIKVDKAELEDARWFSRDEIKEMLANCHDLDKTRMPAPLAIAHQIAKIWIEETGG